MNAFLLMNSLSMQGVIGSMDGLSGEPNLYILDFLTHFDEVLWWVFLKVDFTKYMEWLSSFKASDFIDYLNAIKQYFIQNVGAGSTIAILCDNASIHKTNEVLKFWKDNHILLIWITRYSPWLNPVEEFIGWIKSSIRAKLKQQRYANDS